MKEDVRLSVEREKRAAGREEKEGAGKGDEPVDVSIKDSEVCVGEVGFDPFGEVPSVCDDAD